jgi:hypothetical protein
MSEASYEFGVLCEAPADRDIACGLADRVLIEEVSSWLEPEMLDSYRQWVGLREGQPFLAWKHVDDEVKKAGLKVFGRFNGEPGGPDAFSARRALLLFAGAKRRPDAVLLI